ncbi:MAG: response regulator [Bdellovibrionales bacterium]
MAKLRFLVVEDEPDILEFNSIMLMNGFVCDVVKAKNGQEAVQVLQKDKEPFDCIISDYSMIGGNADILHKYVLQHHPELPFLLATAGFYSDYKALLSRPKESYLQKPFEGDQLIQAVKKLIKMTEEQENAMTHSKYVPMSWTILSKLSKAPGDIYIQINPAKYTRILRKNEGLVYNDLLKYEAKGAKFLYVDRREWKFFVFGFLELVNALMLIERYRNEPAEILNLSGHVQEVLQASIKSFGWTPEAQEAAHKNIQIVKKLIENQTALKIFRDVFNNTEKTHGLLHSILLSYVINLAYTGNSHIEQPRDLEYLTLAAFVHDATLDEHLIRNETSLVKAVLLDIGANKKDRLEVQEHPEKIYRILEKWAGSTEEFLQVLVQHHETLDGQGFPAKVDRTKIGKLAQAFIVSHELTELYLHSRDINKTFHELSALKNQLSCQPYDFFEANLKLLENAIDARTSS